MNSARVDDPGVEDVNEGGAVDDGHAEEEADVAADLGVEVGQAVVPDDAPQLGVTPNFQVDVAHALVVEAEPVLRHPREELHRGARPGRRSFIAGITECWLRDPAPTAREFTQHNP